MNKMKEFFIHNTYNPSQQNNSSLVSAGAAANRSSIKKQQALVDNY
jgi:hypothetical protein